jgi:hypothetical protein
MDARVQMDGILERYSVFAVHEAVDDAPEDTQAALVDQQQVVRVKDEVLGVLFGRGQATQDKLNKEKYLLVGGLELAALDGKTDGGMLA